MCFCPHVTGPIKRENCDVSVLFHSLSLLLFLTPCMLYFSLWGHYSHLSGLLFSLSLCHPPVHIPPHQNLSENNEQSFISVKPSQCVSFLRIIAIKILSLIIGIWEGRQHSFLIHEIIGRNSAILYFKQKFIFRSLVCLID